MAPILHADACPDCGGGGESCADGEICLPSDYIDPDDCPGCPDGEECLPDDYIDPATALCLEGSYAPYCLTPNEDDLDTTILALSPWAYWPLDDASGNPQDASGNGRHATSVGATATYQQAALSSKAGLSLRLSAGGRVTFPALSTNMEGAAVPWTLIMLLMLTSNGEGLTANGVVWLGQQQASTALRWGLQRVGTTPFPSFIYTSTAARGAMDGASDRGLNVPYVFAIQCLTNNLITYVNGVPTGGAFRDTGASNGQTMNLGRAVGTFFDMPALRASNLAVWNCALSHAQILTVTEAMLDSTIVAGGYVP